MTKKREKEILALLKKNGKTSPKEIGDMLNLSEKEVQTTISSLEKTGVIVQYCALINAEKLPPDLQKVHALIEVRTRPEKKVGFENVANHISRFPNVVDVFLLSGTYDLLVIVEGAHLQEIARFVSEKLSTIENVRSTVTHFILKKYKTNGVILGEPDSVKRLLVSP